MTDAKKAHVQGNGGYMGFEDNNDNSILNNNDFVNDNFYFEELCKQAEQYQQDTAEQWQPTPEQKKAYKEKKNVEAVRKQTGLTEIQIESVKDYIYTNNSGKQVVSCPLLSEYIRQNVKYIFVRDNAKDTVQRYIYKSGCYRLVSPDEFKGGIKKLIPLPLQRVKDINEVFNLLITDSCFIDRNSVNADENIINFKNGILHLDTMELKPHSPDYMSTVQIPCNYIPNAPQPQNSYYNDYINTLTQGDIGKQELILQFLGMAISNIKGYRPKKALFMVGEGDSGKSQIRKLAGWLVGKDNNSNVGMDKLEGNFGASNIYNKRLIGSADMSYMVVEEVKTFKELTGGDEMQFEFKFESQFTGVFNGVAWFCCNKLPKFGGDKGKHVYNRMAIIDCKNVVPLEEQDSHICDKMMLESDYIVSLAIEQLKRVIKNRYKYIVPIECDNAKALYQVENNPVLQFVEECTEPVSDSTKKVTKGQIYKSYQRYCKVNGIKFVESARAFKNNLDEAGQGGTKTLDGRIYFANFTLTEESYDTYIVWWAETEISPKETPFS